MDSIKKKHSPQEAFLGVPREKIPWYPTIDYQKCVSCGKCVEYCTLGVYQTQDHAGKKTTTVKKPYNCVVLCNGCDAICPVGAISHPSKVETRKVIRELKEAQKQQR